MDKKEPKIPSMNDMGDNQFHRESFRAGEEAMTNLVNMTNRENNPEAVQGMLSAFMRNHRTLQQNTVRMFVAMMCHWAKLVEQEPNWFVDLRNEASAEFAKKLLKDAPGFPFI